MGFLSKLFGQPSDSPAPRRANFVGKRFLLVEPSVTIRKVIELVLDGSGAVLTTKDARDAKATVAESRFDVVMTAVLLGDDMTGYDLCALVKQATGAKVIVLHGAFEAFDEGRARQAGADAVLSKPFTPDALLDEIERVLAH